MLKRLAKLYQFDVAKKDIGYLGREEIVNPLQVIHAIGHANAEHGEDGRMTYPGCTTLVLMGDQQIVVVGPVAEVRRELNACFDGPAEVGLRTDSRQTLLETSGPVPSWEPGRLAADPVDQGTDDDPA